MNYFLRIALINVFAFGCLNIIWAQRLAINNDDPRFIGNGIELPKENYVDQPYVIVCDDGSWLCAMTTSSGTEGAHMNHIVTTKSYDKGKTWTSLLELEPTGVPQSSWGVPLKVPGGRIYVFYNYNEYRVEGIADVFSAPFMFRYSDDHGKSWSDERYEVPIRKTSIDYSNYSRGEYQFFWSVAKPIASESAAYITFTKLNWPAPRDVDDFDRSEGFILKSENILTVKDPKSIKWTLLPEGDVGIHSERIGRVQSEHNSVILSSGEIYVVNRTNLGSPAFSISKDGGKTFSRPEFMFYMHGERIGNTRACTRIHKMKDGKYLLWYHNNFKRFTFDGRNPAWIAVGKESNGTIEWSQPEILLYDDDPYIRGISYPDFIEQDGRVWVTATQKTRARVHEIDIKLLDALWTQLTESKPTKDGLIMDQMVTDSNEKELVFPSLPNPYFGGGFTVELWVNPGKAIADQEVFRTLGGAHRGLSLAFTKEGGVNLRVNDGDARERELSGGQLFTSDKSMIIPDRLNHVVFIVDGASKIVTAIVNGVLSDGDAQRSHGWSRLHAQMKSFDDGNKCYVHPSFSGTLHRLKIYDRYLLTSEAIANYKAGL